MNVMIQRAPWPHTLEQILKTFVFKPGWKFELRTIDRDDHYTWNRRNDIDPAEVPEDHCVGLTLLIWPATTNSYDPTICVASKQGDERRLYLAEHIVNDYNVVHLMPVPAATYNEVSWRHWLIEQIRLVEQHETCEFATFDGVKFFAPIHAPGYDPYMTTVQVTDEARRTSFRGELNLPKGLDSLISAEEAAQRLGLSVSTVKRYCASGKLKATRATGRWLVDKVSVANLPNPHGSEAT